jgi:hypothetical protein
MNPSWFVWPEREVRLEDLERMEQSEGDATA